MYLQVYYHPTTRSFEIILTKMLDRYKELADNGYQFINNYDFLQPLLFEELAISDYLALDESTIIHYAKLFTTEKDELLSEFATKLLNRKLFKHSSYSQKLETKVREAFKGLTPNYEYYIEVDKTRKTGYAKLRVSPEQLIFVLDRDKIVELSKASKLVANFANLKEEASYLFYDKELLLKLPKNEQDIIFELIRKNY
jgi:HD superfamily phosphohydrolase